MSIKPKILGPREPPALVLYRHYRRLCAQTRELGERREEARAELLGLLGENGSRGRLARAIATYGGVHIPEKTVSDFLEAEARDLKETPYLACFHGDKLKQLLALYAILEAPASEPTPADS